jgi:hypothetical protein
VGVRTAHTSTGKIAARTICRWLAPDQHRDYQAWIDNDRRLRDLLARLEALGAAAFDADPQGTPGTPARQQNRNQGLHIVWAAPA